MSMQSENSTLAGAQRAHRFPVRTSLRFRTSDEEAWLEGETQNVSRSGILFRAREPISVGALVELRFVPPKGMGGRGDAAVSCHGWIIRATPPDGKSELPTMAANILTFLSLLKGNGDEP